MKKCYLAVILMLMFSTGVVQAEPVEAVYSKHCASCHGENLNGGKASALNDDEWKYANSPNDIAKVIKEGLPEAGKKGFAGKLSDEDIRGQVVYIQEQKYLKDLPNLQAALKGKDGVYSAGGHSFKLQRLAKVSGQLWSFDFLPAGKMIATEKTGKLWVFDKTGKGTTINGIPKVDSSSQGGLLEVQVHPEYKKNAWIYLTLSHPQKMGQMTKVVRGKLKGNEWSDEETIYQAPESFYHRAGHHYGSRLVFHDGYVFFSVGDRGQRDIVPQISNPYGKIHRLHDDGRIPKDNPFVKTKGALASIWSYGHRNSQGLALHPQTKELWEAEHGPRGGDEINVIFAGKNYGWPRVSYGIEYSGMPLTAVTEKAGIEPPAHYWVPSIAVSEIDFYVGDKFPAWKNQLMVSSLAKQELHLLKIKDNKVVEDTVVLKDKGRIRDLASGPDGYPYLILNNNSAEIVKLVPVK